MNKENFKDVEFLYNKTRSNFEYGTVHVQSKWVRLYWVADSIAIMRKTVFVEVVPIIALKSEVRR